MATRLDTLLDEQQRTDIGHRLFDDWARTQRGAPRHPAHLVDTVTLADDYVGLYATQWEGRRAVWKTVPSSGQVRPPSPALPPAIDPWSANERGLREQSDHVAVCDGCAGEGKRPCSTCGSHGTLTCAQCRGARKMYGYAANGARRLLNCQGCRGKGEIDCADCRRGIAICARCAGERRLQRWLEIERWTRFEVSEHPPPLARQYGWTGSAANAEVERHAVVVADVERSRAIAAADAPNVPQQWLELLPRGGQGERVVQQRLRIVRIPKVIVSYTVGRARGDAEFSGLTLRPPLPDTVDAFSARSSSLRRLAGWFAVVFVIAAVFTLARGLFFWSALSAAALCALFVALMFAWLAAAEATGRRQRTRGWAGAAFFALLLAGAFTWLALPTREHAARAIAAGELAAAERELNALGSEDTATLWAELRLARMRRATELEAIRRELDLIPRHLSQHGAAVAVYLPLAWKAARDEAERAQRLPSVRERLKARLAAERAYMDWEAVSGRSGTPELIELRTAMAYDIATIEREDR